MSEVLKSQALSLIGNGLRADQVAAVLGVEVARVEGWARGDEVVPVLGRDASTFEAVLQDAQDGAHVAVRVLSELVEAPDLSANQRTRACSVLLNGYSRLLKHAIEEREQSPTANQPMTMEDLRALIGELPPSMRAALLDGVSDA